MRVFSLLPMLIHTNNVINAYLVKYPQINMQKYTGYILENRFTENNGEKVEWIWEKDGYFSGSNYYYVNALKELYEYYEAYEKKYIDVGTDNQRKEKEYYSKLVGPNGEITKLKDQHAKAEEEKDREIAKRDNRIAMLEQLLEEEKLKKPTIEDGIRELIQKEFDTQFVCRLTQVFLQAAGSFAPDAVNPIKDENGIYAKMFSAMIEMIVAESYANNPTFKNCTPEEYHTQTKYFKNDIRAIINHNIDDIFNDINHRSNMYTKLG